MSENFNLEPEKTHFLADGEIRPEDVVAATHSLFEPDYVDLGGLFCRTLRVATYPAEVGNGWLNSVYLYPGRMVITQFVAPLSTPQVVNELTERLQSAAGGMVFAAQRGRMADPYAKSAYESWQAFREALVENRTRAFQHQLVVGLFAESKAALDEMTRELQDQLRGETVELRTLYYQQEEGLRALLPYGQQVKARPRDMDSHSLKSAFPFSSSEVLMPEGEMWGYNPFNGSPVMIDRSNPGFGAGHWVVIAVTRTGKSFAVKGIVTQSLFHGRSVAVIDPSEGGVDYRRWVEHLEGEYVVLSPGSADRINPMDIAIPADPRKVDDKYPVSAKAAYLIGLLSIMLNRGEQFEAREFGILDQTIRETYRRAGIEDNWTSLVAPLGQELRLGEVEAKPMPVLSDLRAVLRETPGGEGLADALGPYTEGSFRLFDGQTNVDINNPILGINIYALISAQQSLAPTVYYVLTEFILQRLRADRTKKEIVLDEAHHMFKHVQTAQFVERLFREAGKSGGRVTLITHSLSDFVGSGSSGPAAESARVCLKQAAVKLLLQQNDEDEVGYIGDFFKLSGSERRLLLGGGMGQAEQKLTKGLGIALAGGIRTPVQIAVNPGLYNLITTDPEEVRRIEEAERRAD